MRVPLDRYPSDLKHGKSPSTCPSKLSKSRRGRCHGCLSIAFQVPLSNSSERRSYDARFEANMWGINNTGTSALRLIQKDR
ncbi:hypothetical protein IAQ61_001294 [Plenodomus lingam]|uniref:uncharacterized protein n=1 Tax=Leptosphaeria maculans TaxID=5022 RepID=UPI0033293FFA|nr:hypothetical protein IAQ61_001294 [Plenodomus lingam]